MLVRKMEQYILSFLQLKEVDHQKLQRKLQNKQKNASLLTMADMFDISDPHIMFSFQKEQDKLSDMQWENYQNLCSSCKDFLSLVTFVSSSINFHKVYQEYSLKEKELQKAAEWLYEQTGAKMEVEDDISGEFDEQKNVWHMVIDGENIDISAIEMLNCYTDSQQELVHICGGEKMDIQSTAIAEVTKDDREDYGILGNEQNMLIYGMESIARFLKTKGVWADFEEFIEQNRDNPYLILKIKRNKTIS